MTKPRKAPAHYITGAPDHVAAIYDHPKTFDRYTVVYTWEPERNGLQQARGMSERPQHPQGFGQIVTVMRGSHLGRLIAWADLPEDCKRLVIQDGQPD